ncbi:hypothetical protein RKD23_001105 [Streptomyces sp. SAI-170]
MVVTKKTAADQDMQWGYILRPTGIEVISVVHADAGPLIAWDTDPHTPFSDHPGHWPAPSKAPVAASAARPPQTAPAQSTGPRPKAARR